jgi:hypothetical protein
MLKQYYISGSLLSRHQIRLHRLLKRTFSNADILPSKDQENFKHNPHERNLRSFIPPFPETPSSDSAIHSSRTVKDSDKAKVHWNERGHLRSSYPPAINSSKSPTLSSHSKFSLDEHNLKRLSLLPFDEVQKIAAKFDLSTSATKDALISQILDYHYNQEHSVISLKRLTYNEKILELLTPSMLSHLKRVNGGIGISVQANSFELIDHLKKEKMMDDEEILQLLQQHTKIVEQYKTNKESQKKSLQSFVANELGKSALGTSKKRGRPSLEGKKIVAADNNLNSETVSILKPFLSQISSSSAVESALISSESLQKHFLSDPAVLKQPLHNRLKNFYSLELVMELVLFVRNHLNPKLPEGILKLLFEDSTELLRHLQQELFLNLSRIPGRNIQVHNDFSAALYATPPKDKSSTKSNNPSPELDNQDISSNNNESIKKYNNAQVNQNLNTLQKSLDRPVPLVVVGDLHNNLANLFQIFDSTRYPSDSFSYVFLGNLIEEPEQLFTSSYNPATHTETIRLKEEAFHCLSVILSFKLAFPVNVYFLKNGNEMLLEKTLKTLYEFIDLQEKRAQEEEGQGGKGENYQLIKETDDSLSRQSLSSNSSGGIGLPAMAAHLRLLLNQQLDQLKTNLKQEIDRLTGQKRKRKTMTEKEAEKLVEVSVSQLVASNNNNKSSNENKEEKPVGRPKKKSDYQQQLLEEIADLERFINQGTIDKLFSIHETTRSQPLPQTSRKRRKVVLENKDFCLQISSLLESLPVAALLEEQTLLLPSGIGPLSSQLGVADSMKLLNPQRSVVKKSLNRNMNHLKHMKKILNQNIREELIFAGKQKIMVYVALMFLKSFPFLFVFPV